MICNVVKRNYCCCDSYDYWFVYHENFPKKLESDDTAQKLSANEAVLGARVHLNSVEDTLVHFCSCE